MVSRVSKHANLAFVLSNFFHQGIPFDPISLSFRAFVLNKVSERRKLYFAKYYIRLLAHLLGSVLYIGRSLSEVGELVSPSKQAVGQDHGNFASQDSQWIARTRKPKKGLPQVLPCVYSWNLVLESQVGETSRCSLRRLVG
jgi:hypothetical protein